MKAGQSQLWEEERTMLEDSIQLTIESLAEHGAKHSHWIVAFSGGKDSTTLLTVTIHAILTGLIQPPKKLSVCYADTRMEMPPLTFSVQEIGAKVRSLGFDFHSVMAPLDKRFLVYILGRGVPPPNNRTLRWCTRQIKFDPMAAALKSLIDPAHGRPLVLNGVRVGESVIRDQRIAASCGINGSECGQGWYQAYLPDQLYAGLSPILHWRVCHVWDWLWLYAPSAGYGGWPTSMLAEAYGGDEALEINARTGCICCPLASKDTALDTIIKTPQWAYLRPLKRLRALYESLRLPENRLRKDESEDHRMGPITLEARELALAEVLAIQNEINFEAMGKDRPHIDILNTEEEARIRQLIAYHQWPNGWTGEEMRADESYGEDLFSISIERR